MKTVKIKVSRNGVFEEYEVPENITVLDALNYINKTYNKNIQYRASCRAGQCGSCAMTINNEPKLACKTKVEDGMKIEPLRGFKVIKDLIVDRSSYYKKLYNLRNYLQYDEEEKDKEGELLSICPNDIKDLKNVRGCIDCLSCLSICPSRKFSDYAGPTFMRQLARFAFDPRDKGDREKEAYFEHIYNCTTCGKCVEVCPQEIDIVHKAIEKLRALSFKNGYYLNNHLAVRENVLKGNRSVVKEKTPLLEDKNIKEEYIVENEKMRVAFFTGCLVDYRLQDVGKSAIRVLNAHGISVIIPKNQVCCGSPFLRTGQRDVAHKLKKHNLNIFNNLDVDAVVTICAGCGSTLKNDYVEKDFKVMDITELLNNVGLIEYKPLDIKVTYHDPCHLKRGQGIYLEPRNILKNMPNLEFIEMEIPDQCCGAGGGVRSGKPEVASAIGKRKAKMIYDTDADCVITVCPFCEYHIRDSLNKLKSEKAKKENLKDIKDIKDIKVMNIASLLDKVI
ncbi:fumarate reductase (CoM/CoB) subunit TfrB [Methanothermococcus okinawensis]|uniref:Succinate dehydrogenase and fumarate reductase iron-sulfur protein n=1 Tax=Methanothermococcus okinawensis (strain DSM 14208 / JCM 11175 / IH1) TaxID=647113 RepID=F8AJW0_METOI|nr:fumarate reductase (CoM/CoB) subunit TfrB [Methanothermococcus okinawensis]AEH07315.1 succinate dehydrogenase and fumarate reductase iron-sulfur protein [Methanothermococcus okinawensis IH1]